MIDKERVKKVVMSLRHANRELLKKNKIDDCIDDFITLSIKLE